MCKFKKNLETEKDCNKAIEAMKAQLRVSSPRFMKLQDARVSVVKPNVTELKQKLDKLNNMG
jgi:hypothetical protein